MSLLNEVTQTPLQRQAIVEACVKLIDEEVGRKSGLSGFAIKSAYGVFKALKPTAVRDAVDGLLDDFIGSLEPFYNRYQLEKPLPQFDVYLCQHQNDVATALLQITDARAAQLSNRSVKALYERLRPMAARQVEQAVPGIATIMNTHLPKH